jgi:GTP cyclohydrolase II
VVDLSGSVDADVPAVRELTHARIPTAVGAFVLRLYANDVDHKEHMALIAGDIGDGESVLVRVHSECFTGEVVGSLRCDCGPQLDRAIEMVAAEGRGVIVYLRQEGRGIGLAEKLRAYNLQDEGLDTVDANLALGHGADERDYTLAAAILHALGVRSVRLLTNNPLKVASLQANGLAVGERVPLGRFETAENAAYLRAKVERMGHMGGGGDGDGR